MKITKTNHTIKSGQRTHTEVFPKKTHDWSTGT